MTLLCGEFHLTLLLPSCVAHATCGHDLQTDMRVRQTDLMPINAEPRRLEWSQLDIMLTCPHTDLKPHCSLVLPLPLPLPLMLPTLLVLALVFLLHGVLVCDMVSYLVILLCHLICALVCHVITSSSGTRYIMDEFGSAFEHSEAPNFRFAPFLFMPDGTLTSAIR